MRPRLAIRTRLLPSDRQAVREIVASTGFFNLAERAVAVELVDEYLARGEASGYRFVFADDTRVVHLPNPDSGDAGHRTVTGYACYGPIAGTQSSFDLYWIAIHADFRNRGIGSRLLGAVESAVERAGGCRLYAETSSREQYAATRSFYQRRGFRLEARLREFYGPGDDKLIYVRLLAAGRPQGSR